MTFPHRPHGFRNHLISLPFLTLLAVPLLGWSAAGCADSGSGSSATSDASDASEETGADVPVLTDAGWDSTEPSGPLEALANPQEAPLSGLQILAIDSEETGLEVKIRGVGLKDLFGVACHIVWDPEILSLESLTAASPLTTDIPSQSILHERDGGRAVYGTARFHTSSWGQFDYKGVDLDDAVFATFKFSPVAAGETIIAFRDLGRDVRDASLKPIEDLEWVDLPVTVAHSDEGAK